MNNTYDPYRLKKPKKRTNSTKGANEDPKWIEISWDEAFETIASRLNKIKSDDPRKLIWQHGRGKYLIQEQYAVAFTRAFGTPNMVHRTTLCEAARHVADDMAFGSDGIIPDLSLPEAIILRKVLKPRLIALFFAIVATGILLVGYVFNLLVA